ncbi:MAG: hypothetical protein ACI39U_05970, partial [Candidatus Cryptobacteroides sp.]
MDKKRVISGLSAFAASIMLLSCTDRTWVGVVEGEYEDAEDALPIPVIVGVGNPSLESKGSGAIDSDEGNPFSDVDVYVYAFNSTSGAPFRNTARSRPDACLIDGSLDFPNTNAGRRAHFDGKELYLQWPDAASETYYPASTDAWTFYAYYIDGYQPTRITRNNDDITIPIVIDGAMDVMTGRAVYDESVLDNTFSDTEKSLIRQRAFSAYTARRGVNPIITFRHHLTRLRFVLYPASDDSYTVVVNSIKVQSKNTGTFTAVARDISDEGIEFSSAMAELELSEADGSP